MKIVDAEKLENDGWMLVKISEKPDKFLTQKKWEDVSVEFDLEEVFKKMWRESEEVCGNTMIEVGCAEEIILEALSGGLS